MLSCFIITYINRLYAFIFVLFCQNLNYIIFQAMGPLVTIHKGTMAFDWLNVPLYFIIRIQILACFSSSWLAQLLVICGLFCGTKNLFCRYTIIYIWIIRQRWSFRIMKGDHFHPFINNFVCQYITSSVWFVQDNVENQLR